MWLQEPEYCATITPSMENASYLAWHLTVSDCTRVWKLCPDWFTHTDYVPLRQTRGSLDGRLSQCTTPEMWTDQTRPLDVNHRTDWLIIAYISASGKAHQRIFSPIKMHNEQLPFVHYSMSVRAKHLPQNRQKLFFKIIHSRGKCQLP